MHVSSHARVEHVLKIFKEISQYPRPSKKEDKIREYLIAWAVARKFPYTVDTVGNCIITAPASAAKRDTASIILQSHMDMVCEKMPHSRHNFETDPLDIYQDGDWLRARDTTLGADNGIGMALSLALVDDDAVSHPQTELLFTVDEETGLTGATALAKGAFQSDMLLNLDSEDDAVLIVGCAGGANVSLALEYGENHAAIGESDGVYGYYTVRVSGLSGGHSGVDINKNLGNAIRLGAEIMQSIADAFDETDFYIGSITSGTVHNAIPRDFEFTIAIKADIAQKLRALLDSEMARIQKRLQNNADHITYALDAVVDKSAIRAAPMRARWHIVRLCQLLQALPNGVLATVDESDVPLTSASIAILKSSIGKDEILISLRSLQDVQIRGVIDSITALAKKYHARCAQSGQYPAWEPTFDSPLLKKCSAAFWNAFAVQARVEVIHAGLEPAVIAKSHPQLDMLSCGPLLLHPHSPDERLSISSTARIYTFLQQLFRDW